MKTNWWHALRPKEWHRTEECQLEKHGFLQLESDN